MRIFGKSIRCEEFLAHVQFARSETDGIAVSEAFAFAHAAVADATESNPTTAAAARSTIDNHNGGNRE